MTDRQSPYRVERGPSGWKLLNALDRVVMTCGDERSASHYATLLNTAWRDGYRAGYAGAGFDRRPFR